MDNFDILLREAGRHGMSYGAYMAAINDGLLPRPIPARGKAEVEKLKDSTRECRYCHRRFEPDHSGRYYCSPECFHKKERDRYNARYEKVRQKRRQCDGKCIPPEITETEGKEGIHEANIG